MNKSLTPFIILFSLVILTTVIIINSGNTKAKVVEFNDKTLEPSMTLSPFTDQRKQHSKLHLKKQNQSIFYTFDADAALIKAKRHLNEGDLRAAEENLRNILVFDPKNKSALYYMGGICLTQERYGEAEYIFSQLTDKYADNIAFYNNFVITLEKQKKYKEAITALQKILIVYPQSAPLLIDLARMYSANHQLKESLKALQKAYDIMGESLLPLTYDPLFDNLRTTPEFMILMQKIEKDALEKKHSNSNGQR